MKKWLETIWVFLGLKWEEIREGLIGYEVIKASLFMLGLTVCGVAWMVGVPWLLSLVLPLSFDVLGELWLVEHFLGIILSMAIIAFKRWLQRNWKTAKGIVYGMDPTKKGRGV